jgi:hypothetical protein
MPGVLLEAMLLGEAAKNKGALDPLVHAKQLVWLGCGNNAMPRAWDHERFRVIDGLSPKQLLCSGHPNYGLCALCVARVRVGGASRSGCCARSRCHCLCVAHLMGVLDFMVAGCDCVGMVACVSMA